MGDNVVLWCGPSPARCYIITKCLEQCLVFTHCGVANNIPINVLQLEEKGHLLQSPKYSTHLHYLCSLHPK